MKQLVVITGASSGIGKELSKYFVGEGYPTLLLARRVVEDLQGDNVLSRSCDITDKNSVAKAIKEAEAKFGSTDLLINCAGVMLLGDASVQDFSEWERMIDVNVKGILTTTSCVLNNMRKNNRGTIINISSIAGRKTFPNHAVYCGTKFAVHAITENIRKEVASSNVRMITIAPGVVETPLLSHTTDEVIKADYNEWKKVIAGGLDPKEIVDCVKFAYAMPQSVCIREIVIAKTKQED